MPSTVVVGAQWGDEAKGKLVDLLSADAAMIVRYSGGNNAGHTVVVGSKEYRFQLIPSGILHPGAESILGAGTVICPKGLLEELDRTRASGAPLGRLFVSAGAHVVFPYHRKLDALEEEARGADKIGTTSRGIGPAYQDKVARIGIRMGEFVDPTVFGPRLRAVLSAKNRLLKLFDRPPMEFDEIASEYSAYAARLRPMVADTDAMVQDAVAAGKRVLFEGAQGAFLDLDSGTYPYVTSGHPVAGGACLGTGIGPLAIDAVLGVAKAYTTRVGEGPFPTELNDAYGEAIREAGKEFGTVTGRPRRCGWLDLALLRRSCRLNSTSALVVTRLDVLSGLDRLRVAVGYAGPDGPTDAFPTVAREMDALRPIYEEHEPWSESLRDARTLADLPAAARSYLARIEAFTGTPIAAVSVGPDRAETIFADRGLLWPAVGRRGAELRSGAVS